MKKINISIKMPNIKKPKYAKLSVNVAGQKNSKRLLKNLKKTSKNIKQTKKEVALVENVKPFGK